MKNIYRGPEKAYAALDFTGRGYILEEDMLSSNVMPRIKYSREDVKLFFRMNNMFSEHNHHKTKDKIPANSMNFDHFKKSFFPHLYLVAEEPQSDEEKKAKRDKKCLKEHKER